MCLGRRGMWLLRMARPTHSGVSEKMGAWGGDGFKWGLSLEVGGGPRLRTCCSPPSPAALSAYFTPLSWHGHLPQESCDVYK